MKWMTLTTCGLLAATLMGTGGQAAFGQEKEKRADRLEAIEQAIERLEKQLPENANIDLEELQEKLEGMGLEDGANFELMFAPQQDKFVIGVQLNVEADDDDSTITVSEVIEGSAASKAGLKSGDVIKAVNGKEVKDANVLIAAIQEVGGQGVLKVTVIRDGEEETFELKPEKSKSFPEVPTVFPGGGNFEWKFGPEQFVEGNPMVFGQTLVTKEEVESLRDEVKELREQMSEMMKELKAIRKQLEDQ